jgi:hypothetical protein
MSDANGVGTGGTSIPITVLNGPSDCLATSASSPQFYFYLDGPYPTQCGTMPIQWDASRVQGTPRITAIVPGGQSFRIPASSSENQVNWTTNVRTGTDFLIAMGDDRGFGVGGSSEVFTVRSGSSGCINQSSPSSTAAPAAGGIYATGSGGGTVTGSPGGTGVPDPSGSDGGKGANVGAIVGGVSILLTVACVMD